MTRIIAGRKVKERRREKANYMYKGHAMKCVHDALVCVDLRVWNCISIESDDVMGRLVDVSRD